MLANINHIKRGTVSDVAEIWHSCGKVVRVGSLIQRAAVN